MLQSPIARNSNPRANFCSDESGSGSGSGSEAEAECDDAAAPEWLDDLLPLPCACCVVPAAFPLPSTMNSRILAASPDVACCSAVLGYVEVVLAACLLAVCLLAVCLLTVCLQCSDATGYSLHFMSQRAAAGIPLELTFAVTRHCPALFTGDLLLVTDAWLVSSASAARNHSYLEVARCHIITSAACLPPPPAPPLPVSPSPSPSSCRGSVDAITSACTATGQPTALLRVCNATIAAASKARADHTLPLVFVVLEHAAALSSLAWARCCSEIHLNDLRPKFVSDLGDRVKVYYSTPSTRCTLPAPLAAPAPSQPPLAALYKATVTGCICSGV